MHCKDQCWYLSQCKPTPPLLSQQQSANKFGLQVGINFGLGEGEVHNCSDTDIDASEEGSLRTSLEIFSCRCDKICSFILSGQF